MTSLLTTSNGAETDLRASVDARRSDIERLLPDELLAVFSDSGRPRLMLVASDVPVCTQFQLGGSLRTVSKVEEDEGGDHGR